MLSLVGDIAHTLVLYGAVLQHYNGLSLPDTTTATAATATVTMFAAHSGLFWPKNYLWATLVIELLAHIASGYRAYTQVNIFLSIVVTCVIFLTLYE